MTWCTVIMWLWLNCRHTVSAGWSDLSQSSWGRHQYRDQPHQVDLPLGSWLVRCDQGTTSGEDQMDKVAFLGEPSDFVEVLRGPDDVDDRHCLEYVELCTDTVPQTLCVAVTIHRLFTWTFVLLSCSRHYMRPLFRIKVSFSLLVRLSTFVIKLIIAAVIETLLCI